MDELTPPAGFERINIPGGFSQAMEPVFMKQGDGIPTLGFFVTPRHCNSMGICHGGAIMSFADMALCATVTHAFDRFGGTPTINLSVDFITPAQLHDWVTAECRSLHNTWRTGFADACIQTDDRIIARASGLFRIPEKLRQEAGN